MTDDFECDKPIGRAAPEWRRKRKDTMERRSFLRFLAAGGAIALAPGLAACTYREYEGHGVWYRYPYGYYDYYYYPDVNVYFHLHSGYYYYPRHGVWIRSRRLLDHYHLKPAFRRRLVIRHPNPYEHNGDHRREWEGQMYGRAKLDLLKARLLGAA